MKKDDLVHLKFDYGEALNSVRDILYIEKSLMTIAKSMKEYNALKKEETKIRLRLYEKTSQAKKIIDKLQKTTPKVKGPKIAKVHEEKRIEEVRNDGDIEQQLQDIQSKLNSLANQKF